MQTISTANTWTQVTGLEEDKQYLIQAHVKNIPVQDLETKLIEVYWAQQELEPTDEIGSQGEQLECSGDENVWVKAPCSVYITVQEVI